MGGEDPRRMRGGADDEFCVAEGNDVDGTAFFLSQVSTGPQFPINGKY